MPKIRSANFQPSPGKIERLIVPGGFGVRFDSHAHSGYVVPPYYDSMIGKLIVHQPTRAEAIRTMLRALAELRIEGIKTTIPLHQEILSHSAFAEGRIDTTFVERTFQPDNRCSRQPWRHATVCDRPLESCSADAMLARCKLPTASSAIAAYE